MKKSILKMGVMLLLVAVLVTAGVYPLTSSQAAAKKTTYNVVLGKGSDGVSFSSVDKGGASETVSGYTGTSFKMVVTEKATKEKGGAVYYPVTFPAKSFKFPGSEAKMPGGTTAVTSTAATKDGTGKLYISGGDVDVSSVMSEKKVTTKIGDSNANPANSLIMTLNCTVSSIIKETGKSFLKMPMTLTFTTGTSYIVAQGCKGKINGKAFPDNDTLKMLQKPLVGTPLDLNAGTGTLTGSGGSTNLKSGIGLIDWITGITWILNISK